MCFFCVRSLFVCSNFLLCFLFLFQEFGGSVLEWCGVDYIMLVFFYLFLLSSWLFLFSFSGAGWFGVRVFVVCWHVFSFVFAFFFAFLFFFRCWVV